MAESAERGIALLERELDTLHRQLARREEELETTREELRLFALRYARTVGARFEELRTLRGDDPEGSASGGIADQVTPSGSDDGTSAVDREFQRLYREVARRVHPDLARDQEERALRTRVMAEVNAAQERRDMGRARQLLDEWETQRTVAPPESEPMRADRLLRTIERLRARLVATTGELARLRQTNLHILMSVVEAQRRVGVDMLEETAADLDRQLAEARAAPAVRAPEPAAAPPRSVPALAIAPIAVFAAPGPVPGRARVRPMRIAAGLAVAAAIVLAALTLGPALRSAARPAAVVTIPSTEARPSAASAPSRTPEPRPYRVLERVGSTAGRTTAIVRIVVEGEPTPAEKIATLAEVARRELRSSQAVLVFAYRAAAESGGPFTVGRAYLSADGRGWGGDGLTEDGPDDGGVVGSLVASLGASIDTLTFRAGR